MKNTVGAIMLWKHRQCRICLVTLLLILSCDIIGTARARSTNEDSSNSSNDTRSSSAITPHDITRSAIAMQLSTIIEGHRKDADAVAISYGWDATEGMYLEAENKIDAVYIAQVVNADTTYCTAAFRGTSFRQVQDWFVNLDLDPVSMSRLSSPTTTTSSSTPPRLPCEVHGGYYAAYMQFEYRTRVETFLQNCHTKCHQNTNNNKNHTCETLLIGHSQGGGIAEIAAVHYLQQQQQQQEEVQDVRPSCNPSTGCSNKNRTPTTTTTPPPPPVVATTAIDSDNAENQKETEGGGAAAAANTSNEDTIVIWCDPRTGCSNKNRGTLADTTRKNNEAEDQDDKIEEPSFHSDSDRRSSTSTSSSSSHPDQPYVLTFGGVPALGAGCNHLSVLQDIEQRRRWFRYIMTQEGGKKLVYDPIPMVFAQLLDPPDADDDDDDDDDDDRTISTIVDTLFDGKVTVLNRLPETTLNSSYARHGGLAYLGHELLLSVEDPSVMYQTGFDQHRYVDLAYIDVTGMAHHVDPYYNTLRAQDEFYNGNNSNNNNNAFSTPVRTDGFGKGSLCNPEEESLTVTAATTTTTTATCGTGLVCAAEKEAGASWWSLAFWDTTPKYVCQEGTKEQEQQSSSSLPSSSSVSLDKNSASASSSSSSSTLRPSVSPSIGIPTARSSTSTMESTAPATATKVPSVPNGRSDIPGDRDTAAATDGSESSRSPVVLSTTITPALTTASSTMMASSSSSSPRSSGAEWMKVLFSTATTTILLVVVFVSSMFV